MVGPTNKAKRQLNFELNLIPFIDVLSACICFLLMTTVFLHVGTVDVEQAIGETSGSKQSSDKPAHIYLGDNGELQLMIDDASISKKIRPNSSGGIDVAQFKHYLSKMNLEPHRNRPFIVVPSPKANYETVIQVVAALKGNALKQVGIAPF